MLKSLSNVVQSFFSSIKYGSTLCMIARINEILIVSFIIYFCQKIANLFAKSDIFTFYANASKVGLNIMLEIGYFIFPIRHNRAIFCSRRAIFYKFSALTSGTQNVCSIRAIFFLFGVVGLNYLLETGYIFSTVRWCPLNIWSRRVDLFNFGIIGLHFCSKRVIFTHFNTV